MPKYLYLPRLKDENVLIEAIREGLGSLMWQSETFAYAEGWDEGCKRCNGLKKGTGVRVLVDGHSLDDGPTCMDRVPACTLRYLILSPRFLFLSPLASTLRAC